MVSTEAMLEPTMAAKKVKAKTADMPVPPRRRPSQALAASNSCWPTLPL